MKTPTVLLLTELFPPDVGGSPVLFEAIYSRLPNTSVVVLADNKATGGKAQACSDSAGLRVVRRRLAAPRWGVLDPKAFANHLRVASETRRLGGRGQVIVHCGRALPEGVAACISHHLGGPSYLCWAHGEDITTAHQSRELTWLMTRVYRDAAANIANSQSTARMLVDLGMPSDRVHVIYPGVDVQRFQPHLDATDLRAQFASDGRIILLSVGRLQRRKGHDLAIEAVSRLRKTVPLRYLIVGDGAERRHLERLVAEHRLQDHVCFLGEVPAPDLPHYYAACDIFLLPNRIDEGDVEGFGIVFLEAAATGRPAIGGRSGGVPEAVLDGETGRLVSGTDAGELAATIQGLASSPETRHAMGTAGRERVCRSFTWERAAVGVSEVHAEIASRNHGTADRRPPRTAVRP